MRSQAEFESVQQLAGAGGSDTEISKRTGIPRETVNKWRHGAGVLRRRFAGLDWTWRPADAGSYCYLLGVYLGDGCISCVARKSPALRVSLDALYPGIIRETQEAIRALSPGVRASSHRHPRHRLEIVVSNHEIWGVAFPQHGPGRKHLRRIELADWQAELTARHPKALLRGLIHSDGCRTVNRFKTRLPSGRLAEYEYERYFFSNLSTDIRRIFCRHCDLLGVHWTQSNHRNISISRRDSVALLDSFIGPKT